jgi:hypothetical protein
MLVLLPLVIACKDFTFKHGFLALPRFGGEFRERSLESVKRYAPASESSKSGYDGQFYAQIALDPSLQHPGLSAACDTLPYRAKRIGLPVMAYILGAGDAWIVLQIYSVLNIFFWIWLAWMMVRQFGCQTTESQWLLIGVLWSAGVLISISRALTDLPALCLSVAALTLLSSRTLSPKDARFTSPLSRLRGRVPSEVLGDDFPKTAPWCPPEGAKVCQAWDGQGTSTVFLLKSILSSILFSLASLTKETAILSIGCLWDGKSRPFSIGKTIRVGMILTIIVLPVAAWSYYVAQTVGRDNAGMFNFTYPFVGFLRKLYFAWSEAFSKFPRMPILEMLAPISMAIQAIWMVGHTNFRSRWWSLGAGAVLLSMLIGDFVWASQSAYSRCLLPMTVAFNVTLFQDAYLPVERKRVWWWVGNLGLLDRGAIGIVLLAAIRLAIGWACMAERAETSASPRQ